MSTGEFKMCVAKRKRSWFNIERGK